MRARRKPAMWMTEPRLSKASWKRERGSEGVVQAGRGSPICPGDYEHKLPA